MRNMQPPQEGGQPALLQVWLLRTGLRPPLLPPEQLHWEKQPENLFCVSHRNQSSDVNGIAYDNAGHRYLQSRLFLADDVHNPTDHVVLASQLAASSSLSHGQRHHHVGSYTPINQISPSSSQPRCLPGQSSGLLDATERKLTKNNCTKFITTSLVDFSKQIFAQVFVITASFNRIGIARF